MPPVLFQSRSAAGPTATPSEAATPSAAEAASKATVLVESSLGRDEVAPVGEGWTAGSVATPSLEVSLVIEGLGALVEGLGSTLAVGTTSLVGLVEGWRKGLGLATLTIGTVTLLGEGCREGREGGWRGLEGGLEGWADTTGALCLGSGGKGEQGSEAEQISHDLSSVRLFRGESPEP